MSKGNKVAFTKAFLEGLVPPEAGKRLTFYDARLAGLELRVAPGGAKSFYVQKRIERNGKPLRRLLGHWPLMTIEQARILGTAALAEMVRGELPTVGRRAVPAKQAQTVEAVVEWWRTNHADAHVRRKDLAESLLTLHILPHLGGETPKTLGFKEVVAWHALIGTTRGKVVANRAATRLRAVLNKGIRAGLWDGPNPVEGLTPFPELPRKRTIGRKDLPAFMEAIQAWHHQDLKDFVLLSLSCGGRKDNVLSLRWADVHLDEAWLQFPETKQGGSHEAALTKDALALLKARRKRVKGDWVFPARVRKGETVASPHRLDLIAPFKAFLKSLPEPERWNDLRIHDLRRTFGTTMLHAGVGIDQVGLALHHSNQASTRIYTVLDLDPMREQMERASAVMKGEKTLQPGRGQGIRTVRILRQANR